jgi:TetR/AcrR family acrAB operon transcriptional repressor
MRRTKEAAAQTRQTVIDAALRLFSQRGYSGTTFRAIAEEAGCSRGPIYWHFANKKELFEEILSFSQRPLEQLVVNDLDLTRPRETARAFAERWLTLLIDDPYFRQSFEIFLNKTEFTDEMVETISRERALTDSLVSNFALLVSAVRQLKGKEPNNRGDPRRGAPEGSAHVVALSMYAYLMGITQTWLFNSDIVSLAQAKDQIVNHFCMLLEQVE